MICRNCGQELKDGVKFCTKCGNRFASQNGQQINGLAISSIVLMLIGGGILAVVGTRFVDFFLAFFVVRFYFYLLLFLSHLLFLSGVILAFISLFKTKNKIILIAGIISVALYLFFSFLMFRVILGFLLSLF